MRQTVTPTALKHWALHVETIMRQLCDVQRTECNTHCFRAETLSGRDDQRHQCDEATALKQWAYVFQFVS